MKVVFNIYIYEGLHLLANVRNLGSVVHFKIIEYINKRRPSEKRIETIHLETLNLFFVGLKYLQTISKCFNFIKPPRHKSLVTLGGIRSKKKFFSEIPDFISNVSQHPNDKL